MCTILNPCMTYVFILHQCTNTKVHVSQCLPIAARLTDTPHLDEYEEEEAEEEEEEEAASCSSYAVAPSFVPSAMPI